MLHCIHCIHCTPCVYVCLHSTPCVYCMFTQYTVCILYVYTVHGLYTVCSLYVYTLHCVPAGCRHPAFSHSFPSSSQGIFGPAVSQRLTTKSQPCQKEPTTGQCISRPCMAQQDTLTASYCSTALRLGASLASSADRSSMSAWNWLPSLSRCLPSPAALCSRLRLL